MADLQKMTDEQLAEYQAGWRAETRQYILAAREWKRRDRERDTTRLQRLVSKAEDHPIISILVLVFIVVNAVLNVFSILAGILE